MKRNWLAVSIASGIGLCSLAGAVTAENTGSPQTTLPAPEFADVQPADALGVIFENQAAGISLRVPAGCHRIQSTGAGDDIGQFGDEKRQWQLKLTRISRPAPTPLTAGSDNFAKPVPGLMDQTIAQLKRDLSGCTILRQDLTNIGDGDPKI